MPFVTANKIRLHYQILGDENAPLLTILGGLGDNIRNWTMVATQMDRHLRLLLIDNRSAGQSERPSGPYQISDMAEDVLGLWNALSITRSHLLGFSMGGKIALHLALNHPDRIEKLILVATTAGSEKGPHPFQEKIKTTLQNFSNTPEHFSQTFDFLFSDRYKSKFKPEMFVKFKLHDPHPQSPEDFAAQLQAVRHCDLTENLHHVVNPTLILHGDEDHMTSVDNAHWLKAHIPHAELKIYPRTGHIPQAEETKKFVTDITDFLRV